MTIRKLIYMILSWLAILSLAGALFMLVMLNFNQANGRVVNYSGIVRGGAQRIAKIHLLGEPVDDIVASLEKTMNGLIDGDKSLGLPKATDPAFREKMEAVRSYWNDTLKAEMIHEPGQHNPDSLYEKSETFFSMTNEAVAAAEAFTASGIFKMQVVAVITFAVNLLCIIVVGLLISRRVLSPLKRLESGVAQFADGDLSAQIDYQSPDELGALAESMRRMMGNLRQYIREIQYQLQELSQGNLDLKVQSSFHGDFSAIEHSLDRIICSLNETMSNIGASAEQVAMSSNQVAMGIQTLASGASEESHAMETLTVTLSNVSGQVGQTAATLRMRATWCRRSVHRSNAAGSKCSRRYRRWRVSQKARPASEKSPKRLRISPSRQISWPSMPRSKLRAPARPERASPLSPTRCARLPTKAGSLSRAPRPWCRIRSLPLRMERRSRRRQPIFYVKSSSWRRK